jgi:glycosyltransferase involved in cell wall biosynthesis
MKHLEHLRDASARPAPALGLAFHDSGEKTVPAIMEFATQRALKDIRVLYISYPLLTVSRDSAGGAEQILWTLEREMARLGVETAVAASAGSSVAGALLATGRPCRAVDDLERRDREHQDKIVECIRRSACQGRAFDLVHDMSGSFWSRAAEIDAPVLATLHLPRHFYPPEYFQRVPANVSFICVSDSQARSFADLASLRGVVANGIALDLFKPNHGPRNGLLWLGRICEEKSPHLALDIAARAGLTIILAGQVYPFSYHQRYFDSDVEPRLREMPNATFVSRPSFDRKRQLLSAAHALLITSQVEETSSLVAMEAAASGTPVIASRRGALPEVIRDGVTGFLADSVEDYVRAFERLDEIDHGACVRHAREHFSSTTMAQGYARHYARIVAERSRRFEPSPGR